MTTTGTTTPMAIFASVDKALFEGRSLCWCTMITGPTINPSADAVCEGAQSKPEVVYGQTFVGVPASVVEVELQVKSQITP